MDDSPRTGRDRVREAIKEGKLVKAAPLIEATDLSRNAFYGAIRRGEIEAVYVGKAIRIPPHEAARLIGLALSEAA